ncbi:hypothetical protein [Sphingobacterium chuzhouense]|uniref:Uncharacterized protein n=1 Tax=Sphingobacterium chuzhouense TaxID=1742264 RepID=A0ABR7XXP2_9SPHI|nr:hypothetical protein [Sphingobacterium chuzhouense]MBD1423811.1 hypothetical protein [Sphingobacterium chuzhouense]
MKIFRKLAIYTWVVALLGVSSCENPLKDFNLQISTEVIEHYVTLRVVDTEGNNINGVSVALVSGDTQDIYNMNGYKDFKLTDNLITLGVDPKRTPTANNPIRFRVQFSASGYNTQTIPVAITDASAGIQTVVLTRPIEVPDGAEEVVENVELDTEGSTTTETVVELPSAVGEGDMTLTVPSGTQFKDANGTVITGTNVQIVVTSIDANNEDAVVLLPGGDLRSDEVILEGGSTAAGTFSPAAVADIRMLVNGTQVRQFSQPLVVSMPVPANYVSPITGQALTAGTVFQIFSNSGDGVWRFERNSTVTGSAATGFRVSFPVTHLTFYMAGEFAEACSSARVINFSGDWMSAGATYPILVDAVWGGKVIATGEYSINASNNAVSVMNVPASGVTIVVRNSAGNILEQGPLAACGQTTTMQLPNPGDATGTTSTLQLYVRCPGQTNVITLLPTFQLFYRESGTTEFKYLGEVNNGYLRTSLLKTDGTEYDFKAIWGERVKIVNNHTVSEDNTATVGTAPGDIIGEHAGMTNLAILTQECNNL